MDVSLDISFTPIPRGPIFTDGPAALLIQAGGALCGLHGDSRGPASSRLEGNTRSLSVIIFCSCWILTAGFLPFGGLFSCGFFCRFWQSLICQTGRRWRRRNGTDFVIGHNRTNEPALHLIRAAHPPVQQTTTPAFALWPLWASGTPVASLRQPPCTHHRPAYTGTLAFLSAFASATALPMYRVRGILSCTSCIHGMRSLYREPHFRQLVNKSYGFRSVNCGNRPLANSQISRLERVQTRGFLPDTRRFQHNCIRDCIRSSANV